MSKSSKAKSQKKLIADFRLTAASVILSNLAHIAHCTSDMQDMSNMAELCEQYSLFIVLNSFATKYGFPICTESIRSDIDICAFPLLSWPSLADRYPLQIHEPLANLFSASPEFKERTMELLKHVEQVFPSNPELIGEFYQQTLSAPLAINERHMPDIDLKSDERTSGEFYTPAWVADHALKQWLSTDSASKLHGFKTDVSNEQSNGSCYLRILDPSCGTGNFLLAAMRMADEHLTKSGELIDFARSSLYGRDIDGRAIELTKFLLLLYLSSRLQKHDPKIPPSYIEELSTCLDQHIRVKDSFLESIIRSPGEEQLKFDLVITNPPYISFGARDQQRLSRTWQGLIKRRFPASSEYKIRLTSIFQEIGIELLCSDGQCIYLVPDAFLTGSYYQRLRHLILQKVEIVGLTELPDSTISGATVGRWCLVQYKAKAAPDTSTNLENKSKFEHDYLVRLQSITESASKTLESKLDNIVNPQAAAGTGAGSGPEVAAGSRSGLEAGAGSGSGPGPAAGSGSGAGSERHLNEFHVPISLLVSKDKERFQMIFSQTDLEIISLCRDLGFVKERMQGHTGIRARNGQASIIASTQASPAHYPGLISGAELSPYKVRWKGNWLEVVPQNLFAGGFDPAIIANPKILVRQTGDRLIAAADLDGYYHLNNVHSFSPSDPKRSIYFFTCLLNSSFYLYYYRLKTREHKRALAQIDIETVEHMPLPQANSRREAELEEIGRTLSLGNSLQQDKLLAEMEDLVFQLFDLSPKMSSHVLSSIALV